MRETLELFAGYFRAPRSVAETVELVGLADRADVRVGKLSGGQQRRLDVAVGLIGDPDLLFLDEPTTGFDPSARHQAWEVVAGLRDLGKTIFLTTHYMDEAQRLADRVAIISGGRIVAEGRPDELGDRGSRPATISFTLAGAGDLPALGVDAVRDDDGAVRISTHEPVAVLNRLTGWALERDVELDGLDVRRPSLEDIYLELAGEAPRDDR